MLGGSGAVGRWLVRLAAERGHEITALARPAVRLDALMALTVAPAEGGR